MPDQRRQKTGGRRRGTENPYGADHPGRLVASAGVRVLVAVLAVGLYQPARAGQSDALSYEEASAALYDVSDTLKASEAAVSRSKDEARAAETLGLPAVFANTTEVFGEKTGTIDGTPLGNINFSDNLRGPRASVNATWAIYSGGRITATQRALAAGIDAAHAELNHTEEDLDVLLATEYFGLELEDFVFHVKLILGTDCSGWNMDFL